MEVVLNGMGLDFTELREAAFLFFSNMAILFKVSFFFFLLKIFDRN
jgi:hypothetical protein